MTTENNTNIRELISLIKHYFPSNLSYDDPAYQASAEHQRLLKKQKDMLENTAFLDSLTSALEQVSYPYPLINWSNLEDYPDIEYKILLHKHQDILDNDNLLLEELNGVRKDLYLWISIIGKYYYYTIEKMIKRYEKYYFCYDVLHDEDEVTMVHRLEQFFAQNPVLTRCFLTLDEAGKCLRVAFNQERIHKPLTAALLQPQPRFAENLICAERLAIALPCRQELTRRWHLLTVEVSAIHKVCAV